MAHAAAFNYLAWICISRAARRIPRATLSNARARMHRDVPIEATLPTPRCNSDLAGPIKLS